MLEQRGLRVGCGQLGSPIQTACRSNCAMPFLRKWSRCIRWHIRLTLSAIYTSIWSVWRSRRWPSNNSLNTDVQKRRLAQTLAPSNVPTIITRAAALEAIWFPRGFEDGVNLDLHIVQEKREEPFTALEPDRHRTAVGARDFGTGLDMVCRNSLRTG